jgi:hypothetical protein
MPKFDPRALSRRSANADLPRGNDAKRSDEFGCAIPTHLGHDLCLRRVRQSRKAKQHDAVVRKALPEHQITEVLVGSQ